MSLAGGAPVAAEPYPTVKAAALALLSSDAPLQWRDGQFLGGIICADRPLSHKQLSWLGGLLRRNDLPPLTDGVA